MIMVIVGSIRRAAARVLRAAADLLAPEPRDATAGMALLGWRWDSDDGCWQYHPGSASYATIMSGTWVPAATPRHRDP